MEKVKITQEQADAIEKLIRNTHIKFKYAIETSRNQEWSTESFTPLNGLSFDKFINVIRYGYEVEPEFKVGDWVAYNYWGLVGKVVSTDGGIALDNRVNGKLNPNDFKRATPQEIATEKTRIWWAKHDRDVWDLKSEDVLSKYGEQVLIVDKITSSGKHVIAKNIPNPDYKHAPFSKKYLWQIEKIKREFKVLSFAQDRKDI